MRQHAYRRVVATAVSWSAMLVCLLAIPTQTHADPLAVGSQFQVNTYTTGDQGASYATVTTNKAVARAPDGRFVVVWESSQDGDQESIHAQLYDADGSPNGTEFQVNSYTTGRQTHPAVGVQSDGRFLVVWHSDGIVPPFGFSGIAGRHFDATGAPLGSQFVVNTYTSFQNYPDISVAGDDSFVVVWWGAAQAHDSLGGGGLAGQRFDASASPQGTEFGINVYTTGNQLLPAVCHGGDDSFVVAWLSGSSDVFARRYASDGSDLSGEVPVATGTAYDQGAVDVGCFADGGFMPVWTETGTLLDVVGRRYDNTNAPVGPAAALPSDVSGSQMRGSIAVADDDSVVVAWADGSDGDLWGVEAMRFDSLGAADGTEFAVNTYTTGNQYKGISVAIDANDDFVVTWQDLGGGDGDGEGTFGQLYCVDADNNDLCDSVGTLPATCSETPQATCNMAAQAKIDVNEKTAGKEKLKLQWKKLTDATEQGDFGDPVAGSTSVVLCIYDDADALVQQYVVDRAGQQCAGKDCWKAKGTKGYGYKDKDNSADGVSKIGFGSGDAGKGGASAGGKNNAAKGQNSLPTDVVMALSGNSAPTIQMITSDGFCMTATMTEVKKDEPARYAAQVK